MMSPEPPLPPRALVVEDELRVAQLVAEVLEAEGYEVDTAANGLLALEKIEAHAYDLIVSDLRMPELDGLGISREHESAFLPTTSPSGAPHPDPPGCER